MEFMSDIIRSEWFLYGFGVYIFLVFGYIFYKATSHANDVYKRLEKLEKEASN